MSLIDSHCHLESFQKKGDLGATLDRARAEGLEHLVAIGTDTDDWSVYRQLRADYPDFISYTVGMHPCHVDQDWWSQVSALASFFIPPHTPVGLGEIGLDYYHLPNDKTAAAQQVDMQEEAFRHQLDIALQLDCPLVIHSRNAFDDCVRIIDESGVDWRKVVFHCFSEGSEQVKQLNERGGRASFTGIITYKSAESVREAAREQGIERLMIETDCPYLTPVPLRGKPNEPAYLAHIAKFCANLFGMESQAFEERVTANTREFFFL